MKRTFLYRYKPHKLVDLENGIVKNSFGQIEYTLEFNEYESLVIYRNTDGEIIDYYRSSQGDTIEKDNKVDRNKIYIEWEYHEKIKLD